MNCEISGNAVQLATATLVNWNEPCVIFIPTLTAGGAERVASLLAQAWSLSRKVVVVTYFDEPRFYDIPDSVEVMSLGFHPGRRGALRAFDVCMALSLFRRCVVRLRPKFVLSFMNKYNAFCLAAMYGSGIPVIISERDSPTEKLPRIREVVRDRLYPTADGLICQTHQGEEFILARLRKCKSSMVIPNPIRRTINPADRDPARIILAVGRLEKKKGFDQLIEAFAGMKCGEGWKLVICGDGSLREELSTLVCRLQISNSVEFAGAVKDLAPFFVRAGMFALSSLYEGYPNALAEAMVAGLPCVSYDCPTGPAEMIQHGVNGLLVPVGDVAALSAALDTLVADSDLAQRLSIEAAKLGQMVAIDAVASRYLDYCESVAAAKVVG